MDKNEEVIKLLEKYEQTHIIKLLDKLNEKQREALFNQINNIDFHQIVELYENTKKKIELKDNKIEAVKYLDLVIQVQKEHLNWMFMVKGNIYLKFYQKI